MEFRHFTCRDFCQNQFKNKHWTVKTKVFGQLRVDGTDIADFATVTLDTCSLARMQGRMLARHKGEGVQGTGKTEHRFYISLDVEEIDNITTLSPTFRQTAAANHTRQHRLLLETFKLADKAQAAFKQANAILLTVQVVLQ